MTFRWLLAGVLVGSITIVAVEAQRVDPAPALAPPSSYGPDLFNLYCATCHGRSGSGDGPVAAALIARPADLTRLAAANGGQFPRQRVEDSITHGRSDAPAHGSVVMPVWGPIFTALGGSDALTKVRIENVVAYIESLQRR